MNSENNKILKIAVIAFTLAGALPLLIFPTLVKLFNFEVVELLTPYLSFNVAVISFMTGTLWANAKKAIYVNPRTQILLITTSILIFLISPITKVLCALPIF